VGGLSLSFGAVGLGAAALSGIAFEGGRLTMVDGPVGVTASVEEFGAAFVREGGGLVLGSVVPVRGDGFGEPVGGGSPGGDDVAVGEGLARA